MGTTETPQIVQDEATQTARLVKSRAMLIGTAGPDGEMRALVRLAGGRMKNLTVGDALDGGRIAAIEVGQLTLAKRGEISVMTLPGSSSVSR